MPRLAILACFAFALVFAAAPARADAVLDGNALLLDVIRAARLSPPAASRVIAMANVAAFDSANAAAGLRFEPYSFEGMPPPVQADPDSAAAAAIAGIITGLFPQLAPPLAARRDALIPTPAGGATTRGAELGRACATAILAARARDGAEAAAVAFAGGSAIGQWRPTPPANAPALLPGWGRVRPWALPDLAPFRPPGPPAIDSFAWADSFNGVKSVGSPAGAAFQPAFAEIARFWSDEEGTETPPGHWLAISLGIASARQGSVVENARLFALLGIALADTAIVVWEAKYRHATWRPITAIREADRLANPRLRGDPAWQPVLATPPFPEYPSGHSAFSAAAARLLALYYGTDAIPIDVTTDARVQPGETRHFDRLSDAAEEAGLSRIYGGIHFYFAHADAAAAGRRVAELVFAQRLRPVRR